MKDGGGRYSLLLAAYPKAYRDRRGEEILGTLLEDAPAPGTYESLRVGTDIVAHGLRLRLGIAPDQRMGRVLVAAALPGMTMAAATAAAMPFFGQVLPDFRGDTGAWGPDTAIWPGLCIVWILGGLAALVLPSHRRLLATVCVAVTLAAQFLLPLGPWGLPPGFLLLVILAVPSLVAARTPGRWSHRGFAVLVGGLVLGALVVACLRSPWASFAGPQFFAEFSGCAPYVAGTVITCAALFLAARRWVQGGALALLAMPWLLFPAVHSGALPVSTAPSTLSIAAACAIGVGLLGVWLSDLRDSRETVL